MLKSWFFKPFQSIKPILTKDFIKKLSGSIFLLLLSQLFFCSCAEQRPLTGGPKDTKAPELDSSKFSTKNFSTKFKEKEIILTFNEWIVLNDPMTRRIRLFSLRP